VQQPERLGDQIAAAMPRAAAQGGDLGGADGLSLMRVLGIAERAQHSPMLTSHAPNASGPPGRGAASQRTCLHPRGQRVAVGEMLSSSTSPEPSTARARGRSTAARRPPSGHLVLAQRMARLLDHRPGLLVLVTGDGAGWTRGDGMLAAAQRLARQGWAVEVLAWGDSLNRHLAAWASRPPHALVELDAFYRASTYVERGRGSGTLDLTRRPRAVPPLDDAA